MGNDSIGLSLNALSAQAINLVTYSKPNSMKTILTSLLTIYFSISIHAQITVTASTFPVAGDTLLYAQAINPILPNAITPPGGSQFWDFSELVANESFEEIYRPAVAGQYVIEFPGADLSVMSQGSESYFNVTSTKFDVMGFTSSNLFGFDFPVLNKNNPPLTERHAPLNFFDIFQQSTNQILSYDLEELPTALREAIQNVVPGVDSIRFRTNQIVLDVVDGWGIVTIPGPMPRPQYPVLRQKRTEYSTRNLDIKINPLGWIDVSSLIGTGNPFGIASYLGTDTIATHHFISNDAKEEIAVITLNKDQNSVTSVRYKNNGSSTSAVDYQVDNGITFRPYPNPAIDWICFEGANLPARKFSLRIFDDRGRVVWTNKYTLEGSLSINVETIHFAKGIYFYRLEDLKGQLLMADQFVIGQ